MEHNALVNLAKPKTVHMTVLRILHHMMVLVTQSWHELVIHGKLAYAVQKEKKKAASELEL